MKNQKLSLSKLKVNSFVTNQKESNALKGGNINTTEFSKCFDTCTKPQYCDFAIQ